MKATDRRRFGRVFSYLRFSTPEQLKGDSQRRQLERTYTWAAKHGLSVDESLDLRDLGVSAYKGKNFAPGSALGVFLEAIETGRVRDGDVLVLENLDRLSRAEVFDVALPLVQRIVRAGVTIVTLDPEREYNRETVREIGPLLEMMLAMFLANEESRKKSERIGHAWAEKRRKAAAGNAKLTARCPAWLRLSDDRKSFELVPDRAKVVRRVFRLVADGYGFGAVAKTLNADGVKPFGNGTRKSEHWGASSVKKLLDTRAALGEYQPHRMQGGKRVPAGEPVRGYFPAVVTEAEYYAATAARDARRVGKVGGRNGENLSNLFTGLLKDARDGSPLNMVNKGEGPVLVSSDAKKGADGSVYISFPYPAFEQALLVWGFDLPLAESPPRKAGVTPNDLALAEAKLADVTARLAKLKEKLKTAADLDVLLQAATELEADRKAAHAAVEKAKAETALPIEEASAGLKELLQAVKKAKGDELFAIRMKLRRLLARLVEDIIVLTVGVNNDRVAVADVKLRGGVRRRVVIGGTPGKLVRLPAGMESLDVREWKKWPAEFRTARFDGPNPEAAEMTRLEADGLSRSEIAERLGVSPTKVTRLLLKAGTRKRTRKAADDPRKMNWHAPGRGWAKTYKGVRYFVGLGTLARLYPKLVTAKTADGSWKAANHWWADNAEGTA